MYVFKHAYKCYFLEALIFIWQYTVLTYLLNIYAVKFWLPICAILGYPVVIMTLVMPLVWDTLQFMGARKVLLDWWTFQTSHLYDLWFQKVFLNFDKKRHGYTNNYIYPFFILNLLYKLIEQIKNAVSPVLFLRFRWIRCLTIFSYTVKSSMEYCRVGK